MKEYKTNEDLIEYLSSNSSINDDIKENLFNKINNEIEKDYNTHTTKIKVIQFIDISILV